MPKQAEGLPFLGCPTLPTFMIYFESSSIIKSKSSIVNKLPVFFNIKTLVTWEWPIKQTF